MKTLEEKISQYRIALYPEYEGGWHADLYKEQEVPICTAGGWHPEEAVDTVINLYEEYKGQWDIEND